MVRTAAMAGEEGQAVPVEEAVEEELLAPRKSPRAAKARATVKAKAAAAAAADGDGSSAGDKGNDEPPAKKARTRAPRAKAAKEEPTADGEGGDEAGEAAAKPKAKRAAKAPAAKKSDGEAGEAEAEAAAEAKPKAKRTKKADLPPALQYTAAMRLPPPPEGSPVLKILTWNVAGLRALVKKDKDALSKLVAEEGVDVVCLQEHKLQGSHTSGMAEAMGLLGWTHTWACSTAKLGYSGVSVATRQPPLSVMVGMGGAAEDEHEAEGRVVTVELPELFVVSCYVPNSGEGLKRLDYRTQRWDCALAAYITSLEARGKPVVLTGDLNCAHKEIDIHNPKGNLRSAGFTIEERESFGRLLLGEVGMVDSFRALHPGVVGYTYFTHKFNCRANNKGWRLDYFLTSSSLMPPGEVKPKVEPPPAAEGEQQQSTEGKPTPTRTAPATSWRVYDSWIRQDVYGSDHLPIGLTLVRSGGAVS